MTWLESPDDEPDPSESRQQRARAGQRRKPRGSRAPKIVLVVLGLLVLGVVLVVLALPLLSVRSDGNAARTNLTAALTELRSGDLASATAYVEDARADVESAAAAAGGTRLGILGKVPVVGGAVADVRNLVDALDQAVAVAEVGVDIYPEVLGEDADIIRDGVVDLSALVRVIAAADVVSDHLGRAHASLDLIEGGTPVVGATIGDARDSALEQVVGLETTLDAYRPLLEVMPSLLGSDEPASYLIAVMNPSELRASGGATLSLAEMTIEAGRVTFGESGNTTDFTDSNEPIAWEHVPDNPWHTEPVSKLVNATFSPNWSTSGEELLRAWEVTTGRAPQALVALDTQALAGLFKITGPAQVEGYGQLTAANLVERLVGSYDDFKSVDERKRVNEAIIPVLREKLLDGGKFVQKAQSLVASAEGRHVVTYFRDPAVQAVAVDLGLGGDLSTTPQDYLGVFTQNTNASKVDFWGQRQIASDVTLNADGSADVAVTVTLTNPTPPYARQGDDPQIGYFTRWSLPLFVTYLPMGAELTEMTVGGAVVQPALSTERGRPYLRQLVTVAPTGSQVVTMRYRVPQAAVPDGDGGLRYALDVDPQGTVNPAAVSVVLRLPEGYREAGIVGDWTVEPDLTLTLASDDGLKIRSSVTLVPE